MQFTLPKTTLQLLLGAMIITTIATGCDDTSKTKETTTDTTTIVTDTTKMDTAKTRPIVIPPDAPAK